jgi:hypothetical protein
MFVKFFIIFAIIFYETGVGWSDTSNLADGEYILIYYYILLLN